jgi:mono/diheme cytochrome c family protein
MFLNDKQMADTFTYVRNAWGNKASQITPEQVKAFRTKHAKRVAPWTEEEIKGGSGK